MATDETEQPAADSRPAGRLWAPIFLGVVLLLAAGFFANLAAAGRPVSPAVWLMLGAAAALLTWRLRK